MTHPRPGAYFLHDACCAESAQKIGSTWLADTKALLHVPDGQNRVSEQHVHDKMRAATAAEARSVVLAQVRQMLGSLDSVSGLKGDAVEEELQPSGDLASLEELLA